jgi:ribonuclease G
VDKVKVDSRETCERLREFAAQYMPGLAEKIEHYSGARPIFDLYGVEDEIQRALEKEVPLKSGGYLVIDQTEAMTTVDVNTGSFLGQRNLEETVYRTNLEAAQAVARQLRLRNLGGIIIIDFIDMVDAEHRRQVLRTLEKSLARDHAKTTVYDFSPLGLVEMTRKRTVESLERQLSEPCHECSGRGTVKTAETVTYEIFREITRAVRQFDAGAAAGDRLAESGGAHHRRGIHRGGRAGGIPRQVDPLPGGRAVHAGAVRCGAALTLLNSLPCEGRGGLGWGARC